MLVLNIIAFFHSEKNQIEIYLVLLNLWLSM